MIIVLMATDLPEPVVPAISKCGIRAKFAIVGLPLMSFPNAKERFEEDFSKLMNLTGKGVYTVLVFAEHPEGSDDGMVLTTISIFFL